MLARPANTTPRLLTPDHLHTTQLAPGQMEVKDEYVPSL
jgi:hypothetical protein